MAVTTRNAKVWGIIPAAGLSRRMGRPKQLLPFRGSTMTGAVTRTVLDAGVSGLVVVTRTQLIAELQLPADPRVHTAVNDDSESHMVDSVRIGLAVIEESRPGGADGVLVLPADMPGISSATCRKCISVFLSDSEHIVIAAHGGKRGHPIVFPFSMRADVDRLDGGLRVLSLMYPERVSLLEVDDPGASVDIDTPDDYDRSSPCE